MNKKFIVLITPLTIKTTLIILFFTQFPTEEPPVDLKIQDTNRKFRVCLGNKGQFTCLFEPLHRCLQDCC